MTLPAVQLKGVAAGHIRLVTIKSIFSKSDRDIISVPHCRTIGDLRAEQFENDRSVQFVVDGARVEDGYRLADRCQVIAMHLPAGPVEGSVILASLISSFIGLGASLLINLLFGRDQREPNREQSSPTYGWTGIANTRTQGSAIARLYGDHRQGGQLLAWWRETVDELNNLQQLYMIIGHGSGPVTRIGQYQTDQDGLTGADLPEGLRLNGIDAKTFNAGTMGLNGVKAWLRMGHANQPALGHPFSTIKQVHTPDVLVTEEWTEYETHEDIQGADVNLYFPKGLFDATSGSFGQYSVTVEIETSVAGGAWIPYPGSPYTFTSSTSTAFNRTVHNAYTIPPGSPGVSDVRLRFRRIGAQSQRHDRGDTVRVQDVLEHPFVDGVEPNHGGIAITALQIDATEQLNGAIPLVTSPLEGRQVPILSLTPGSTRPTLTYGFSRNPAWVALDMLLDKQDGLGNFVTLDDIDAESFIEFAAYCTETVAYTERQLRANSTTRKTEATTPGLSTIVILDDFTNQFIPGRFVEVEREGLTFITARDDLGGGRFQLRLAQPVRDSYPAGWALDLVSLQPPTNEVRAYYDGPFDSTTNAWEAVQTVCRAGFGIPVPIGRKIGVRIERTGDPVQVITDANMIRGSFQIDYNSAARNVNGVECQFLNRDKDFDQDSAPAFTNPRFPEYEDNPEQVVGYGITRYAHASRRANYEMLVRDLIGKRCRFSVPADAVAIEPGDIIAIASTLPDWTMGTSRARGTIASFTVDRDLTFEAGKTYAALVVTPEDRSPSEVTITNAPGTYTAGTAITTNGPAAAIDEAQPVAIGISNSIVTKWRVIDMSINEDLTVEINAAEYNPAIYAIPPRAATWTTPPELPPACLSPEVVYFIDLTNIEGESECVANMLCAGGGGCIRTIHRDITVTGSGAASSCLVIEEIEEGGTFIRLLPGCEGQELCLDISIDITHTCETPEGVPCATVGGSCTVTDQLCFTVCA